MLIKAINEMSLYEQDITFIKQLEDAYHQYDGIKDLVAIWFEESDPFEKQETMKILKKTVNDVISGVNTMKNKYKVSFVQGDYKLEEVLNKLNDEGYLPTQISKDMNGWVVISEYSPRLESTNNELKSVARKEEG